VTSRHWGIASPALLVFASLSTSSIAGADPLAFIPTQTVPDPPPRTPLNPGVVLRPTWDLDGLYLWLGPVAAAGREAATWDSTFGGDATLIRIREHELLGAIGGTLGASKWTTHDGGRIWLDGLVGTEVLGHMVGLSAGPLLELDQLANPRIGGSVGVWGFAGITPYARVGVIDTLGGFVELGIHIALPVFRH
jgi:hypothetical protein